MTIPGATKYKFLPEEEDVHGGYAACIYSLSRRAFMTPNSQGAVTLVCDDGVRRCKTVRQWALLCEREGEREERTDGG